MSTDQTRLSSGAALEPRANNTEIEQRAQSIMLDYMAGVPMNEICIRYGTTPDTVDDLVRSALSDNLVAKRHQDIQTATVFKLLEMDRELKEMDEQLPLVGRRNYQALTAQGKKEDLIEDVPNAMVKTKIKGERRQNALAMKAVLASDTGERPDPGKDNDVRQIISAAAEATARAISEFAEELVDDLVDKAEEVGQLKERLNPTIEASATSPDNSTVNVVDVKVEKDEDDSDAKNN